MLVLTLHKLLIRRKREFIGKGEIKIIGLSAPEVDLVQGNLKNPGYEISKLFQETVDEVANNISLHAIEKVKNKQEINFEPNGLILYKSSEMPKVLNWQLMLIELDGKSRATGEWMKNSILKEKEGIVAKGIDLLQGLSPLGIQKEIVSTTFGIISTILMNDKDDQVGYFNSSLINFPNNENSIIRWKNITDLTGNVSADISLSKV